MITIVVLIIFAGVAINLTLGNNGIFNKAKYAKSEYINTKEKEEEQLEQIKNNIYGYIGNSRDEYIEYSEDEQVVGKWVDGKTIYRKLYITPSINIAKGSTYTVADVSGLNIETLISINGCYNSNIVQGEFNNNQALLRIANNNIEIYQITSATVNSICIVEIRYTKK